MALKVIGAGLGRNGTVSMKLALEHLGFGPCYHAMEIPIDNFSAVPLWDDAMAGKADWDAIFAGYQSTTDYPGCCFWPELIEHYPDAKVILSVRPAEAWWDSISNTLFSAAHFERSQKSPMAALNRWFRKDVIHRMDDKAFIMDYYERWNQSVIDGVPKDRLLVHTSKDGWGPLCAFLGIPVPDRPYPRTNSREELAGATTGPNMDLRGYLNNLRDEAFGSAV
jgi:hypothetical protein